MSELHLPDPHGAFPSAVDRFFEYLQDGIAVNRGIASRWAQAWGSPLDLARVALRTPTDYAGGHGQAITTWVADETALAQQGLADPWAAATVRVPDGIIHLGDQRPAART